MDTRFEEIKKRYSQRGITALNQDDIEYLIAEVERLQEESDHYDSIHKMVMSEKCPTDEVHCTCVPHLRAEVERLEDALREKEGALDACSMRVALEKRAVEKWKDLAMKAESTTSIDLHGLEQENEELRIQDGAKVGEIYTLRKEVERLEHKCGVLNRLIDGWMEEALEE
jgi:hypothetical protein